MFIYIFNLISLLYLKAATKCRFLHDLIHKPREKRKRLRIFLSTVYGGVVGFLIFWFIIEPIISFTRFSYIAAAVLSLFCAVLCSTSLHFRCISILVWLEGLGTAGRSFLKAIVITLVLLGPVANIVVNAKECARVFQCTAHLTYNLTKTRFDLAAKPFQNAFTHMDRNLSDVKQKFNKIRDVMEPIYHEIEVRNRRRKKRMDDLKSPEFYTTSYKSKLSKRCEAMFAKGVNKCEASFQKAFDGCMQEAPSIVNAIVCWPLKIDFICGIENVFSNVANICDPSPVIDSSFGTEYVRLREVERQFTMHYGNVSINYTTSDAKEIQAVKSLNETTRSIGRELERKAALVDRVVYYVGKLMVFIYIKVIYDAINFHDDYLSKIEFNNFYITNYFKKIDHRRIGLGRSTVLPIKNVEIGKFVDLDSSNKISREFEGYVGLSLRLFFQIFSTTFFVLLDRIFFELLDIIARHSRINYLQEGVHNMNITLNGTGFVANLIRASVEGFNLDEHIKVAMTNEPCLPRPVFVESWKIIRIYLLFLLNLYLIYNQVYIHRSKRFVCSFFYPDREKQRVEYLYDMMLNRRKKAFTMMAQRVKDKLKVHGAVQQKKNFFQRTLETFPRFCKCLQCLSFARPKCFICNETQARKMTKDSIYYLQCQKRKCRIIYCEHCWLEMGRRCLSCKYRRKQRAGKEKEIVLDADYYLEHYKTDASD